LELRLELEDSVVGDEGGEAKVGGRDDNGSRGSNNDIEHEDVRRDNNLGELIEEVRYNK